MEPEINQYRNVTKEKLKQKFPTITDEDLHFREGKEKEIMEMLGYKLGITMGELIEIIKTL